MKDYNTKNKQITIYDDNAAQPGLSNDKQSFKQWKTNIWKIFRTTEMVEIIQVEANAAQVNWHFINLRG